jgi:hypothetical protein
LFHIRQIFRAKIEYRTSIVTEDYTCYYCDYGTNNEDNYQQHVIKKHHSKPAYPNKAEIEKSGLKAQGKKWED